MFHWLWLNLTLVGTWLIMRELLRVSLRFVVPVAFAAIIICLTGFAFFGHLAHGWTVLAVTGALGLLLFPRVRNWPVDERVHLVFFFLLSLGLYLVTKRVRVYDGDDFAHWALVRQIS